MFNNRNEYIHAKLEVTLRKILLVKERKTVSKIYDKHFDYQRNIFSQLQNFELDNIDSRDLDTLRKALVTQSLFYSYCFDRYNLLPSLLVSLGCKVVVLVSDSLLDNLKGFIDSEKKRFLAKFGIDMNLQFLTNTTPNLIYRLKQEIANGNKVLVFVDGNKGNENEKEKNLLLADFKCHKILFHQGFGALSYILGNDSLTGLLIRSDQSKIRIEVLNNDIAMNLSLKEYIRIASTILVKYLNNIIQLDNIYLWNSLLNVHEWFVIDEDAEGTEYVPFKVGNNEYYAIEHDTFKVYPIDKNDYLFLKK